MFQLCLSGQQTHIQTKLLFSLLRSPKENYSWMRDQIKGDLNVTIKTAARYQETSPCLRFLASTHGIGWPGVTACAIETISHILICSNLQKLMWESHRKHGTERDVGYIYTKTWRWLGDKRASIITQNRLKCCWKRNGVRISQRTIKHNFTCSFMLTGCVQIKYSISVWYYSFNLLKLKLEIPSQHY